MKYYSTIWSMLPEHAENALLVRTTKQGPA